MSVVSLGIRLQERDFKILKYLSDMGYSKYRALKLSFFNESKDFTTLKKRVKKLKEAKLLKLSACSFKGEAIFSITNLGSRVLSSAVKGKLVLGEPNSFRVDEIDHTIEISQIRSEIESFKHMERWNSERVLEHRFKSEGSKNYIPDGVFETKTGIYVFEYERTQKSTNRIKQKVSEVNMVISHLQEGEEKPCYGLIVCESENVLEKYNQHKLYDYIKVWMRDEVFVKGARL